MRTSALRCSASLARAFLAPTRSSISHNVHCFETTSLMRASIGLRRLHQSIPQRQQIMSEELRTDGGSTITKFDQLAEHNVLHPNIVRTLVQDMKLKDMTEVQSRTINQALKGTDIIAQAKTGTGKTLAFLMPVLQNIINRDPDLARANFRRGGPRTTADDIRAIIISPTRELAEQIAAEAKRLVAGTSVIVQTAVGGTQKVAGLRAIQHQGCHILVGTPGRLHDLLTDEYSRVQAPDLSALVFDEADRLLDQGFWPAIQTIMDVLPRREQRDRQTLMFSATVPHEVVDLVRRTLKPGFEFVQCVNQDDEPTHERVAQKLVVTRSMENQIPALIEVCNRAIEESIASAGRPFKAIVYFPSTAEVSLAYSLLSGLQKPGTSEDGMSRASNSFSFQSNHPWAGTEIFEIHAKLTQQQRTRAADSFRKARSGILLSSDVTARGLDFPEVTHVIQMSTPPSQEQYIHRIGRTARAGKEGEGWLIVSDMELALARKSLGNLPIKREESIETAILDLTRELQVSAGAGAVLSMMQGAMRNVSIQQKIKVYKAMLGVYQKHGNKAQVVEGMNNLAKYGWGMKEPPMIPPGLASKLGLGGLPGIRIGHDPRDIDDSRQGGRGPPFGGRRPGGSGDSFGRGRDFGGRDGYLDSRGATRYGVNSPGGRSRTNFGEFDNRGPRQPRESQRYNF